MHKGECDYTALVKLKGEIMEKDFVLYIHGKGGSAGEAEHYNKLFADCEVVGLDYISDTPWEFKEETKDMIKEITEKHGKITLVANSIGAYFSMNSFDLSQVKRAFFISPIVNMKKLIQDMMLWAGVDERLLKEKQFIETSFGETLSWEYYQYAKNNPLNWSVPTRILYARHDNLTAFETVSAFAQAHNAELTVYEQGEHWFHTDEQMKFLDEWIRKSS